MSLKHRVKSPSKTDQDQSPSSIDQDQSSSIGQDQLLSTISLEHSSEPSKDQPVSSAIVHDQPSSSATSQGQSATKYNNQLLSIIRSQKSIQNIIDAAFIITSICALYHLPIIYYKSIPLAISYGLMALSLLLKHLASIITLNNYFDNHRFILDCVNNYKPMLDRINRIMIYVSIIVIFCRVCWGYYMHQYHFDEYHRTSRFKNVENYRNTIGEIKFAYVMGLCIIIVCSILGLICLYLSEKVVKNPCGYAITRILCYYFAFNAFMIVAYN